MLGALDPVAMVPGANTVFQRIRDELMMSSANRQRRLILKKLLLGLRSVGPSLPYVWYLMPVFFRSRQGLRPETYTGLKKIAPGS